MRYSQIPTHQILDPELGPVGVHLINNIPDKKGNVLVDDCTGNRFLVPKKELRWAQQPAHGPVAHALHELAVYGTQFEVESFDFYLEMAQGIHIDLGFWWTDSYNALADYSSYELDMEPELAHRQRMFLLLLCEMMNDADL